MVLVGEVNFEFYVKQGRLESRKSTNTNANTAEGNSAEEDEKDK